MFNYIKKKIHILQNIYIKNKYFFNRESFAMDGEDIAIKKYAEKIKNGIYIDVGAHHPIQRNNTHLLYKNGWRGVNIDINKFSIELFNFLRPDDVNILSAISDNNDEIDIYFQKEFSQLNTTDINLAKEHFNNNFKTKRIKCQTLNSLLERSKYKDKKIDFINIDVEGAEMKVLKQLNFEMYDPEIICVEILGCRHISNLQDREREIKNDEIYKFLVEKNYKKVWSGSSFCSHLFIK
jgi:FkbM family methyltransferase